MAKALPLESADWEVWENALVWPVETPSSANVRGTVIELVKLGEVLVLSAPKEHRGSVIQPWVSIRGPRLSLEMSDSTEKVEVFADDCISTLFPCFLDLNAYKWECEGVFKTYPHMVTWIRP